MQELSGSVNNNYKLLIKYDGSRFQGWARQPGVEMTIQGKIETVLKRMLEEEGVEADYPINLIASGRTDAGVHALGQVANIHLPTRKSPEEIMSYLNRYLPDDIAVEELILASERFHARYNARGKTYRYSLYAGSSKPVFDRKYLYVLDERPDIELMRKASLVLTGHHDFKAFCANPRMKKSTERNVDKIRIEEDGPYIRLYFHGNGFLQNMVRILTGTILEAGYGRMSPERINEVMQSGDRKQAGPTAPPQGLCLMNVDY
ncbi:tRNA pseudouridine(38-40) synthase TruA [Butyrivibrio sp. MC2013]|uniref:tRNA pseudouridine(38-40) synthase TruA n=1 Tax=Butyrivibrio sp. MC2013 TaxID=1280686 RepID=UPI0004286F5E|nr:tRNA pseudouridine(38-40) synthase TruA [Butyrivibrio sp. MC2013]